MTSTESTVSDDFQPTRWSLVLKAREANEATAAAALNSLCSIYWYPLYVYIRRCGHTPEEAEDLTQSYFESLLSRQYLDRASRDKGKLRAFLLADLKFHLSNERRRLQAQRRGGGATFVPVDRQWAEDRYVHEPADETTPADSFDRRWALTLLGRVLERLRDEYIEKGREDLFEALRPFLSWNAGGDNYAEVAARLKPDEHGVVRNENYVKKNVQRLRERYRKILEDEVAQTVDSPEAVEEEIRHLAAAVC
jgi:DNA-directed RNA polymerase specialized sigma24 family protein